MKNYILKKSKNKIWKMRGVVSCFCDTCKRRENAGIYGVQSIDCALYELLTLFCNVCGETKNLKMCTKCNLSFYCSRKCQIIDHSKHKLLCRMSANEKIKSKQSDQNMESLDDSMLYYQLGVPNYVWKGFLQLEENEIRKRLKDGLRLYTLVQFHDSEIRGATSENMSVIEKVQNNQKILGTFTSIDQALKHQDESVEYVLKNEKEIRVMKGQELYNSPFKLIKTGQEMRIRMGEKRHIRFIIIPFICRKDYIPHFCKEVGSGDVTERRVKILLSWYWSDNFSKDCVKILEVFEDEKIGLELAEKREEFIERFEGRDREIPELIANEDRKVIRKSMADICHYDIIDIKIDKMYKPYILFHEIDQSLHEQIQLL